MVQVSVTDIHHRIVRRLKEGGWEKEIAFMGQKGLEEMAAFTVVRQTAKLTPKGEPSPNGP